MELIGIGLSKFVNAIVIGFTGYLITYSGLTGMTIGFFSFILLLFIVDKRVLSWITVANIGVLVTLSIMKPIEVKALAGITIIILLITLIPTAWRYFTGAK